MAVGARGSALHGGVAFLTRLPDGADETDESVAETRRRVRRQRARHRAGLEARGFDLHPSEAPFLLCDIGTDPSDLLAACREHGVVLRDATTFRGLESHVRIAVRDRESTDALFDALDAK